MIQTLDKKTAEISDRRKKSYKSKTRKSKGSRNQLSTRIGADAIEKIEAYTKSHKIKKVDFIRDAVDYWISVNGKARYSDEKLIEMQKLLECSKSRISELKKNLDEKEEIIVALTELLKH